MRKFNYRIFASNPEKDAIWASDYKDGVTLYVKALSETEALETAKKMVKRKNYEITEVN